LLAAAFVRVCGQPSWAPYGHLTFVDAVHAHGLGQLINRAIRNAL